MNFLEQLRQCGSVEGFLKLVVPENHDEILNNLSKIFSLCYNDDILRVIRHLIESRMFESEELKFILIEAIAHSEENLINSSPILTLYGNAVEYDKDDLKKIFKTICLNGSRTNFFPIKANARDIIRRMYGVSREEEKSLQLEMLELYFNFTKKWGIQPSEKDLKDIISVKCPENRLTEIFEDKPMMIIKPSIESGVDQLVDDEFFDGMQFAGSGAYSMVFKKDRKVVKFSFVGEQYNSYECEQILGFESTKTININGITLSTGTQIVANTDWYKDLSEEEINLRMYEVFCKAKEDGYIIVDIKRTNFGEVDGSLKLIDAGHVYKDSEYEISQSDHATFQRKLESYIKLYQAGYRVNSVGQLEIDGILANPKLVCNEELTGLDIGMAGFGISVEEFDSAKKFLDSRKKEKQKNGRGKSNE